MGAENLDYVSNQPLRERFERKRERGDINLSALAREVGWMRSDRPGIPDTMRTGRALGLRKPKAQNVSYANAVRLADALGMDPHECGV